MPATSIYGLPYPEPGDAPNVPGDIQALAAAVEAILRANLSLGGDLTVPGKLTVAGMLYQTPPHAHLRRDSNQSVASGGSGTAVQYTVEDVDTDPDGVGGHSVDTNPSRWTARYAGWYALNGGVGWSPNATGRRGCWWAKNGAQVNGSYSIGPATASASTVVTARDILLYLAVGDYVELIAYQDSGGPVLLSGVTTEQPTMTVRWVSL